MSENDNKNIEKLDDNLDLTTENEEDNSENNPDIDPELTKIDQSLLDENGDYDKIQPINLSNEMQNSFFKLCYECHCITCFTRCKRWVKTGSSKNSLCNE